MNVLFIRNLRKKRKKERYEQEKKHMAALRGAGCAVGEYVGNGQGEATDTGDTEQLTSVEALEELPGDLDEFPGDDEQPTEDEESCVANSKPLFILFDCESTGFSIYSEHITDIAAKVFLPPVTLGEPTFSCLVRTSRHIPAKGK